MHTVYLFFTHKIRIFFTCSPLPGSESTPAEKAWGTPVPWHWPVGQRNTGGGPTAVRLGVLHPSWLVYPYPCPQQFCKWPLYCTPQFTPWAIFSSYQNADDTKPLKISERMALPDLHLKYIGIMWRMHWVGKSRGPIPRPWTWWQWQAMAFWLLE